MKLLVVTQAVDSEDPALGFFVRWLEEFAKRVERLEVICLKEGKHSLPENVRIHSLGKERGVSRLGYIRSFYTYIWRLRREYDAVFAHMNPEYVVLGGLFWKLTGKRIVLWYTHRQVTWRLRVAVWFANAVATAAKESFRLPSSKAHILGHGIDVHRFVPSKDVWALHIPLRLVSVGRITPIKRLETIIEALVTLRSRNVPAELTLIGAAYTQEDAAYETKLHGLIKKHGLEELVHFAGTRPYAAMPQLYGSQDFAVNAAPTGGLDKAVLESMACGVPTFVANEGFAILLEPQQASFLFDGTPEHLAEKIEALHRATDLTEVREWERGRIVAHANLELLVGKILNLYEAGR